MTLPETLDYNAAFAATFAHDARLFRATGEIQDAAQFQELADEYAASAMFDRLLLIHDDADTAQAAFDYCGDASTEA
jgi:hypothetical protein